MRLVIDASVFVAAATDSGPIGHWAHEMLNRGALYAPELMQAEASNVLRRLERARRLDAESVSEAFYVLRDLEVEPMRWAPCADRIWALRANVTAFDAWYVSVAELLEMPLATADLKLSRATGPRCQFLVPPLH